VRVIEPEIVLNYMIVESAVLGPIVCEVDPEWDTECDDMRWNSIFDFIVCDTKELGLIISPPDISDDVLVSPFMNFEVSCRLDQLIKMVVVSRRSMNWG